jgi:hypothetical protein
MMGNALRQREILDDADRDRWGRPLRIALVTETWRPSIDGMSRG